MALLIHLHRGGMVDNIRCYPERGCPSRSTFDRTALINFSTASHPLGRRVTAGGRQPPGFAPERGAAAAWLTGIVRFRALDAVRRHSREILSGDSALGDSAVEPDVLTKLDADADAQALRRCLETLEDNQRRSVLLAFVDGLSHGDIANRLSAPLGTVKSWVRRGLIALKGCLSP